MMTIDKFWKKIILEEVEEVIDRYVENHTGCKATTGDLISILHELTENLDRNATDIASDLPWDKCPYKDFQLVYTD